MLYLDALFGAYLRDSYQVSAKFVCLKLLPDC